MSTNSRLRCLKAISCNISNISYSGRQITRKTESKPLFPSETWNKFGQLGSSSFLTNNSLESWNGKWNANLNHKSLWRAIERFQEECFYVKNRLREFTDKQWTDRNNGRSDMLLSKYRRLEEISKTFKLSDAREYFRKIESFVHPPE